MLPDYAWQKRLNLPQVKFQIASPNLSQQFSPPAFVVEGDYVNNSPYLLKSVRLTFVLFDSQNKIIGLSSRDDTTIKPFERRAYKQIWPSISGANINRVEVEADTNTLDSRNITVSGSSGNASDLSRPIQENPY